MASLRAYLQAALTVLGLLVASVGVSLAATIEIPPGGGDIPTGFALIFAWGLVAVGVGIFAVGALILDDTGLGTYLSHHQRLAIRVGGGFLLLAAITPVLALIALPIFYGAMGPAGPGQTEMLFSAVILGWLAITAIGGIGVLGGVLWRVGEAVVAFVDSHQSGE